MKVRYKSFDLMGEKGVFTVESTQSGIDSINLSMEGRSIYPYVTRTANNNGVQCYVPKQNKPLEKANTISVGLDTQTVYYQPYEYYTGQNVQIFSCTNLNENTAMYLIPLIKKQLQRRMPEQEYCQSQRMWHRCFRQSSRTEMHRKWRNP